MVMRVVPLLATSLNAGDVVQGALERMTPITPDEGVIFRQWIVKRILAEDISIKDMILTYVHEGEWYDAYEEHLGDLTLDELEAAYAELWDSTPGCMYPNREDMINIIQDNVPVNRIHKYFYTNYQIRHQFEDYLNSLTATKLLDIFEVAVIW